MFHTLSDVQDGKPYTLQEYIDNRSGGLSVGLRSITFTVGWYNVESGESFSLASVGGDASTKEIPPGLYTFTQIRDLIEETSKHVTLTVNKVNGLISLAVEDGWVVLLTDGLLSLLGLEDKSGVWLGPGTYAGTRPVNFSKRKLLRAHLEQISTIHNTVNGAPSTLLASTGLGCHSFGGIHTVRFERPEFKRLQAGTISELTISIRDENGILINNHGLTIEVSLEVA